jgi:hypothetical protein
MTIAERARQEQLERAERDPRRQWGWGVSQMASPEERRAWEALDTQEAIERGEATVADLPEQYGGRPQGTTRRAIRMQSEWDAQQAARLAEEQAIAAREKEMRAMRTEDLKYSILEYDFELKQEDNLFEANQEANRKASEARLAEFSNSLDPTNPASASQIATFIQSDPYLLDSPLAAKRYDYFTKAASNSISVIESQQRKTVDDAVSAALQAGMSGEDIARFKTLDPQGGETFDIGGLRRATDILIGERTVAAEERKEPKDTRTDLEKSQDQLADAKARLGAFLDEGGEPVEENETYRRALADVKQAESRVERFSGAAKPQEKPKSNLPKSGEVRGGFRYTGPSNDKKAASNPDNWVRE